MILIVLRINVSNDVNLVYICKIVVNFKAQNLLGCGSIAFTMGQTLLSEEKNTSPYNLVLADQRFMGKCFVRKVNLSGPWSGERYILATKY